MSERSLKNHLQAGFWEMDSWLSIALDERLLQRPLAAICQLEAASKGVANG
jgi:hypothetical protein